MNLLEQNFSGIRQIGRLYTQAFIRQVVEEFNHGSTIWECCRKYGLHDSTVHRWLDKWVPDYPKLKRYPASSRRTACQAVWSGRLTKYEVAKNYGVSIRTVETWLVREKDELPVFIPDDLKKPKKDRASSMPDEVKLLQQQLEEAKLKIAALNRLIDVAEEQLKIDIRKKPGAKQ